MTTSDFRKVFTQLNAKPAKLKKYIKHNKPHERSCGLALWRCKQCNRAGAHIKKYGLRLCRTCFRDSATDLGFKKYC